MAPSSAAPSTVAPDLPVALKSGPRAKKLQLVGVGYRAALKGKDLEMQLGYSHPVLVEQERERASYRYET